MLDLKNSFSHIELISQQSRSKATLTPADANEHPFSQLISGVGQHDGCVQIATLTKHPEKVGHMEVIISCGNQPTPDLSEKEKGKQSILWLSFYNFSSLVNGPTY